MVEDAMDEDEINNDMELNDQVVLKGDSGNPHGDGRSEVHQVLEDGGSETTTGPGKYPRFNATQPKDMV